MNLCDRNDIQALLARHGFRFAKSLGQNFLIEGWVAEDIAAAMGLPLGRCTVARKRWCPWSWTAGCRRCWRRPWPTSPTSHWWRAT